ncbi:NAD(P)H-dependent oxidoreductase subunit E [candidate division GN15 bacterium]|uniref:NAD(P)H-dependent oxidoreductase subunit E n=1 Tax=candidate division GN15 bacterium TaxID=2072418 RepID=A0A855X5V1_9BACT|nr:MAG: NAD(P)H-dependent oxidoreductase subunit E [candidate division GN15 bacterium]
MKHDFSHLPDIFARHQQRPEALIMILQDIQKEYRYLPCEALQETAKALNVPLSKVFSVATFYNAFSLNPKGKNVVRICVGTACHIRGAALIRDQIENALSIKAGQTTPDMEFSIEVVACVGACAMAPVVIVNEQYHGSVKPSNAKRLVKGGK